MHVGQLTFIKGVGTIEEFSYISTNIMFYQLLAPWMSIHISRDIYDNILHDGKLLSSDCYLPFQLLDADDSC